MSNSRKIYPHVHLGKNVKIEDYVIIGLPFSKSDSAPYETVIQDNAHIRSHTVIYAGNKIGKNFQTGHRAIIGPCNDIRDECSIGTSVHIEGYSLIRNKAKIHGRSFLGAFTVLNESVWIGPNVFLDGIPPLGRNNVQGLYPTLIDQGAILGIAAYVAPGMLIGARALIAGGVNVKHNIQPYQLVVGLKGRSIRHIFHLNCPFDLIDRPYEPENDDQERLDKQRFEETLEDRKSLPLTEDNWRYQIWQKQLIKTT